MEDRELLSLEDRISKIELDVLSNNDNDDKVICLSSSNFKQYISS